MTPAVSDGLPIGVGHAPSSQSPNALSNRPRPKLVSEQSKSVDYVYVRPDAARETRIERGSLVFREKCSCDSAA
jgi:hypothetical protein